MKLEVGMYVRTKKGIFQIRNKDVFIEDKKQYIGVNGRYTCIDIETIEKASHNIIDLIEVGDYVNGYKVEEVNRYEVKLELVGCFGEEFYSETIQKNDIESIVTKEQFESMEYKVGD